MEVQSKRGKGIEGDRSTEEQRSAAGGPTELMCAVVTTTNGPQEVLQVKLVPKSKPKANEVLLRVAYAGVNRPDIHQRSVAYAPNIPGRSPYLGLECSGTIVEHGVGMSETDKKIWKKHTKVCAITDGGSYAEFVAVPVAELLPIPGNTSLEDAATFPQAACTVWSELFMKERLSEALDKYEKKGARLSRGETLLIHRASGGIGTFAVQIARHRGVTVYVTAGNDEKLKACEDLGAELCINHNTEDFAELVMEKTFGKGVNVILDGLGLQYHLENYSCLSSGGCALRNRTPEMKALIVKKVLKHVWPAIRNGHVKALNNQINPFTFKQAAAAHALLESGNFTGKILLIPGKLP